jgi:hypothetical protein
MMHDNHVQSMQAVVREIEKRSAVRALVILDVNRTVLIASDTTLERSRWPDDPGDPPEQGRVVRSEARSIDLVFPAFFAKTLQSMHQHHPQHASSLDAATWVLLTLHASAAHAHYRDLVIQSVIVSLSTVVLGLAAFFFFGMIQKYQLASASIAQLEQIKHHLARFVPRTAQKLIEDNPSRPSLDKVEQEATVLFLDIAHYTKMAAGMAPEALHSLIETYFAAFLYNHHLRRWRHQRNRRGWHHGDLYEEEPAHPCPQCRTGGSGDSGTGRSTAP